jgi:hypothetical protein
VKERYADIDMVRERGQDAAADKAWQQWSKDKSLSNIPTSVLNSMDGKDRDALQATDSAHASGKISKPTGAPSTICGSKPPSTRQGSRRRTFAGTSRSSIPRSASS